MRRRRDDDGDRAKHDRLIANMTAAEVRELGELHRLEGDTPMHRWRPTHFARAVAIYAASNERLPPELRVVPLEEDVAA